MNEDQQSSPLTMGTVLTHRSEVSVAGFLELCDSFDFCIIATLTLFISSTTSAGSVHKSRGDNVVRMWVQLKR